MNELERYLDANFWAEDAPVWLSADMEEEPPNCKFALTAAICFKTSGSSGRPRWVVHTRRSLLASAQMVVDHLAMNSQDVWYLALPLCHVGGFGVLARAYLTGSQVVQHLGGWQVEAFCAGMLDSSATLVSLVPTQVVDLVRAEKCCPPSLRAVIVGGGHLDESIRLEAIKLGWPILLSYGMTETGSQIATQTKPSAALDAGIDLISGWQLRLDKSGRLEVKGGGMMSGYLDQVGDEYQLTNSLNDGWFSSSDFVTLEGDKLQFTRRGGRLVKVLGELVDLDLLETQLSGALSVEAFVVAVDHVRRGSLLVPVVEQSVYSEATFSQLDFSGLQRLEPVMVVDAIPRNTMGKLDRAKLLESVVISRQSV